jgi:hypothetical protein
MFDDFWGEMWDFGAKPRNRPFRAWANRFWSGLLCTVSVNSGGQHCAHLALYLHLPIQKSGRDWFDIWHFVQPFGPSDERDVAGISRSFCREFTSDECCEPRAASRVVRQPIPDSQHSRQFPRFRAKNRRTFTLFTTSMRMRRPEDSALNMVEGTGTFHPGASRNERERSNEQERSANDWFTSLVVGGSVTAR